MRIIKSKKGQAWRNIAKIIIWLVALVILIYIIIKAGQNMNVIIQKIKEIF
ncbi:hypothetical protein KY345_06110 [Candidatus Woesearchaeota archaeon]|nr:hypothetical protein [Candidatus Woesearchaeota archaeon]